MSVVSVIRPRVPRLYVLLSVALSACSVNISSNVPTTTPVPLVTQPPAAQPAVTRLPVTWASLHLTGRLVYTRAILAGNNGTIDVDFLDLATGAVTTIFRTGTPGWVDSAAVSPDGKQLVISYVPPSGSSNAGYELLYILPADGSRQAQPLFTPADPMDEYAQVVWSPDGKYLYFAYVKYKTGAPPGIWRVAYPGGTPEKVVDNAYWPRLSADSTRLTYVSPDPGNGNNRLFVAAADGTQAKEVLVHGPYMSNIIDVPMFAADDQSILFSSPDPPRSSTLKWLDSLLPLGFAHSPDGTIPSDWWTIPISGGKPRQLTHIAALSLYGSYAPDSRYIASYSTNGIFVMSPDGTGVTTILLDTGGNPGTVNWMP